VHKSYSNFNMAS